RRPVPPVWQSDVSSRAAVAFEPQWEGYPAARHWPTRPILETSCTFLPCSLGLVFSCTSTLLLLPEPIAVELHVLAPCRLQGTNFPLHIQSNHVCRSCSEID